MKDGYVHFLYIKPLHYLTHYRITEDVFSKIIFICWRINIFHIIPLEILNFFYKILSMSQLTFTA